MYKKTKTKTFSLFRVYIAQFITGIRGYPMEWIIGDLNL